jgi:hypothetical protein
MPAPAELVWSLISFVVVAGVLWLIVTMVRR